MHFDNYRNAINYAVNNGADVINCSWQTASSQAINVAINNAVSNGRAGRGCVIVAAAGNSNNGTTTLTYPANYTGVIAVGGIESTGNRSSFSSFGAGLDLVAPGTDITSTCVPAGGGTVTTATYSGTSFAAPQVAAVAALILSQNPYLKYEEVKSIICRTATKVNLNNPYTYSTNNTYGTWDNQVGYGLLNAYAAVSSVQISGSSVILGATSFSLLNSSAPITWSVTGPFSLSSSSGNPVTVSPTGGIGGGTLTANSGGTITTKSITTPVITPPSYIECLSLDNVFSITEIPGATYQWYSGYLWYGSEPNIALYNDSGTNATAKFRTYYVNVWTEAWVSCQVTLNGTTAWFTLSVWIWPC